MYFNESSFLYLCQTDGIGFTFLYEIGTGNMSNILTNHVNLTAEKIPIPIIDAIIDPNFIDFSAIEPFSVGFEWNILFLASKNSS